MQNELDIPFWNKLPERLAGIGQNRLPLRTTGAPRWLNRLIRAPRGHLTIPITRSIRMSHHVRQAKLPVSAPRDLQLLPAIVRWGSQRARARRKLVDPLAR